MAAPNIVNITTLTGKTTYVNLTTTGSTSILSNASGSNRVYKINSLFVSNTDTANAVNVTVNYYDSSSVSAALTSGSIAGTISIRPSHHKCDPTQTKYPHPKHWVTQKYR